MPIVNAGGGFSTGTSNTSGDPTIGKSLDEIILERRKEQIRASKKAPKKPTTTDKTIATGKAKREAARRARRGLSQTVKPSAMEVEREVYRQSRMTDNANKAQQKKKTGKVLPADASQRTNKKKAKRSQDAPAAIIGGRSPPKKAIEAAIKGMENAAFKIPNGHQVVMTFVPTQIVVAPKKDSRTKRGKKDENQGDGKGGRRKK